MHANIYKFLNVLALAVCLSLPNMAWSRAVDETPSPMAMTGDALVVRPVMLVTTLVGAAIFIVSSPFSALGGNFEESFEVLVQEPFETTFVRCLGCTQTGRKVSEVVEQEEQ